MLRPVNPKRVMLDGKGNGHLPAHDVIAHLNRVFGFGWWETELKSLDLLFEEPGSKPGRWNACYSAVVRLLVKDEHGAVVTQYEDGSTGSAQNQSRADALDLAMKSAISVALKRAAKNLGDGWGLSLYDKGRTSAVVKATLVGLPEDVPDDVQHEVEQVTSLGHDEVEVVVDLADSARDELRDYCDGRHNLKAVAGAFVAKYGMELNRADADSVSSFTVLLKQGLVAV
jgi:hypothetical protein